MLLHEAKQFIYEFDKNFNETVALTGSRFAKDMGNMMIGGGPISHGYRAGTRAVDDINFVVQQALKEKLPTEEELEKFRDKSREQIYKVDKILNTTLNAIAGGIAGTSMGGPVGGVIGVVAGGAAGLGGTIGLKKGTDAIRTKTKFGQNASKKINQKYIKVILKRKEMLERLKQKLENRK